MKPLSKKARFKLIVISLFVFIILVPMVLASSFGYKIGSLGDVFTLVKTGGVYLQSDISGTSIYIDGEYYKDSGRLLRNTLIQDLLPNHEYEIVVIKEGLQDWRKKLTVDPLLVTEANILMLPVDIQSRAIYPFFDRDGVGTTTPPTTLSINTITAKIIPTNQEYINLMNIFTGEDFYGLEIVPEPAAANILVATTSDAGAEAELPPTDILAKHFFDMGINDYEELLNFRNIRDQAAWIDDGNIRINWINDNNIPNYYFCLNTENCRDEIIVDWDKEIISFEFMPGRDDILIILTSDGIYAVEIDDRSDRNIQPVYLGSNLGFGLTDGDTVFVKDGEIFYELDL